MDNMKLYLWLYLWLYRDGFDFEALKFSGVAAVLLQLAAFFPYHRFCNKERITAADRCYALRLEPSGVLKLDVHTSGSRIFWGLSSLS